VAVNLNTNITPYKGDYDSYPARDDGSYKSLRCPECFWVLFDGNYCQNKDCDLYTFKCKNPIRLTNEEAIALIGKDIKESPIDNSRICDQCGAKPWFGWNSWQCPSYPFGSCDGKLVPNVPNND